MKILQVTDLTPNELQAIEVWHSENDGDYEYIDNYRYAHEDDEEEMMGYSQAAMGGCCGFEDTTLVVDGRTLHYGFNYGH